jgi:hypothetical protein
MRLELENDLIAKYPTLFANRELQGSPMMFGCEHGDGWAGIITAMCELLSKDDTVRLTQVKEKYGALRVYYSGGEGYAEGIVDMAEAMSSRVCERCDKPGRTRGGGWLYTSCDDCEALR